MKRPTLFAVMLAMAAPGFALAAESASPLPANVDHDMLCQLLITHTAEHAEKLPEDRRADMAQMMNSLEHSESFFIGVILARLTDAQITKAADAANTALVKANDDQRAVYLTYCLNDATMRSRHYFEQTAAH